jgi:SAM-dependent methyltransferase
MSDYEGLNAAQAVAENDPFSVGRYQQFARHLGNDVTRVLDVGCGTGRGGAALKSLRPETDLVGLDCVRARLASLPNGVYAQTLCGLSTRIALPDQSVDAVVAGEFIEHLADEDVDETLREFHRVLRVGGVLLLTTPNPGYLRLRITGRSVLGGAHLSQHHPAELIARLGAIGFQNCELVGSGRVSALIGERWPMLALYGSYLLKAKRG